MGCTAFVSTMAEQEDIEAALRNDRPPRDPPNLNCCQASELKTPSSYAGAVVSQQSPDLAWFDVA